MKNTNAYHRKVITEKTVCYKEKKSEIPNVYEPKLRNRFMVEFPEDFEIPSWLVSRVEKPKISASHGMWECIEVQFLDLIGMPTTSSLYELAKWCVAKKNSKSGKNRNFELFQFSIKSLDPTGITVDHWIISVKNVIFDFGNFDYGAQELCVIKMTVEPRDCTFVF